MEKHPEYRYTPVPKLKLKSSSTTRSSTTRDCQTRDVVDGCATSSSSSSAVLDLDVDPDPALDLIYDGIERGSNANVNDSNVERVAPLIQPQPTSSTLKLIAPFGIPTEAGKRDPFRLSTYANIHGTTTTTTTTAADAGTVDTSPLPRRDYPSHEQYITYPTHAPVGNVDPRFPFQTQIQIQVEVDDRRPRPSVDNDTRIFLDPLVQPDVVVNRVMEHAENGGQIVRVLFFFVPYKSPLLMTTTTMMMIRGCKNIFRMYRQDETIHI